MLENKPLSPDLEESARILDSFTRDRFHQLQRKLDRRQRAKHMDGEYSLTRLLGAMQENRVAQHAPLEHEASKRIAEQIGREPHNGCAFVPVGRRDLNVAVPGQGGFFVQPDVGPGEVFTHFLDAMFPFKNLVTRITATSPANIPAVTANVSTVWLVNETSTVTEDAALTVALAASSPKTVGSYVELSRHFLKTTSAFAQAFVMQILARAVANELSRRLLTGASANGQVPGVFTYPGVNTLPGGSANYSKILDAVEAVETDSGLLNISSAAFVTTPAIAKLLRAREKATGSGMVMVGTDIAGYRGVVTAGSSPNAMVFGDWSQLLLIEYGILEIGSDPFGANSALFKSGIVGIRALWTIDAIFLHPESFVVTGALN